MLLGIGFSVHGIGFMVKCGLVRIGFIGPDQIELASFELSSFEPTSPSQKYVAEANTH